jgi:hypothetical protein
VLHSINSGAVSLRNLLSALDKVSLGVVGSLQCFFTRKGRPTSFGLEELSRSIAGQVMLFFDSSRFEVF